MSKNQHITKHRNGGWQVIGAGNSRATAIKKTQKEAIKIAKKIATNKNAEVVIHGKNGKIRAKHSYGSDPFPPKG